MPVVAVGLPPEPFLELFATLEKPGGSVTGFSHVGPDFAPTRMQVLCELMPLAKTLAILYSRADDLCVAWRDQTSGAALRRGLTSNSIGLTSTSVEKLKPLLELVRSRGAEALVVVRDFITDTLQDDILRITADLRMAVIAERRSFAEAGALLSYAASLSELYRGAAAYVDRILKGAHAGDLPIQVPTKFELVVNLKTAKALGVKIAPSVLARADAVIE
jgi:putative ABC transport system substrate-binding protein